MTVLKPGRYPDLWWIYPEMRAAARNRLNMGYAVPRAWMIPGAMMPPFPNPERIVCQIYDSSPLLRALLCRSR